ncbi:4-hydroxy-tetrahydrodipicolinate synthase [Waterburya agarophytonicola K14]|uniref:4-hydroxy-tetrahydrodipicolinate synthase n=1 Tax=Waterburya agarophytonicola KI4 TaxID=2874699 RepID=A0A964FFM6_9CYAN|nr:4-hydroxy-tetrahydrodipicolinate synthase [Waterburya agarophytonicola]MCC0175648.1 4-hydroxy-tetrahydrodipicolinate synthase [Waterburya agarophytonicola KI4]
MNHEPFGRVITAMVTPFTDDGKVNYAAAEKLADYLVNNGSDGLVICGTTGESPTLSWSEEYQLFKVVKGVVGNRAKIIAGTGSNSTTEAISATIEAAKLDLDGSLQVVPYYNKPPQAGLYEHFRAIAEATPDFPMMLYNVPGRTSRNLEAETVANLAQIDNIVAIKEASGDLEQACRIRCLTPDSFAIYSGEDALTLPMLTVGGVGVVSVSSHLVGNQMQEMIEAFATGDNRKATAIQVKLFPLFQALFMTTNPIPVKTALNLQGWNLGKLRTPLCELQLDLLEKLKIILEELDLV